MGLVMGNGGACPTIHSTAHPLYEPTPLCHQGHGPISRRFGLTSHANPIIVPPMLTGQALIDAARALATDAHAGQTRRGGKPYITHPEAVAALFVNNFGADQDRWIHYHRGVALAWLHDAREDTWISWGPLREAGLGDLEDELTVLTHGEEESYLNYILRIRSYRSNLPLLVKLCDIEHNLSDAPSKQQRTKYEMAQWILQS